jgi:hypothetical protein
MCAALMTAPEGSLIVPEMVSAYREVANIRQSSANSDAQAR